MLALSPPIFSTNGVGYWPLDDAIGHEDQNYFYREIEVAHNSSPQEPVFLDFPAPPTSDHSQWQRAEIDGNTSSPSTTTAPISGDHLRMAVKKLNHNASERDRRQKINDMYSSLGALLPASDHMRKLSIPATVSRVLKYIPDLQQQVDGLAQKREELLSRINSKQQGNILVKQEIKISNQTKSTSQASLSSISASQLNDKEVSVQISTYKIDKKSLSEILLNLEKDGLSVLNASSFESFGGRVFHNLHLQVGGSCSIQYGTIGDKITSLCGNNKGLLL